MENIIYIISQVNMYATNFQLSAYNFKKTEDKRLNLQLTKFKLTIKIKTKN